jgi:hypothetical protein
MHNQQREQQHATREQKAAWFPNVEVIDCARPPVCKVHKEEVNILGMCPKCTYTFHLHRTDGR